MPPWNAERGVEYFNRADPDDKLSFGLLRKGIKYKLSLMKVLRV
jgi:hypothetical protein